MSRIYINGRFLTRPMTGVERYAYQVCKALAKLRFPFTVICPHATIMPCYDISDLSIIYYGYGNSHLWEQCVLPFFFLGKKDHLLFSFTGLGPIMMRQKIMTVHDLSFLENPSWFSRAYYWWYKMMTPLAVRTSQHIITVSEFSKKEILRFYPFIKEQDITVAYGAVDQTAFHNQEQAEPINKRFILAVSSIDPRKNFARLMDAFKGMTDCSLYIVGSYSRAFSSTITTDQHAENIKFLGRVSDQELIHLYRQAVGFVFPSIYEGFGLPPIEAMSCGCPVLVSDIPVLNEVCGDAAIYFNPYDAANIQHAVKELLHLDSASRKKMQQAGLKNVQRFSWENTAKTIIRLASQAS